MIVAQQAMPKQFVKSFKINGYTHTHTHTPAPSIAGVAY